MRGRTTTPERPALGTGAVIRYPYLWARQAAAGETEGRKHRPTAVAVRIARDGGKDVLILFAITSQPPENGRLTAEIPETERRRAGLDGTVPLWIILDEYNQDIVGQSFYLENQPPIGHFSRAFFLPVLRKFQAFRTRASNVNRGT